MITMEGTDPLLFNREIKKNMDAQDVPEPKA